MLAQETSSKRPGSWLTYLFVCLFGIGSWIAINGIWNEIPLLVDHLPEKWHLPSYLIITTQLANIGVLTYATGRRIAPRIFTEKTAIFAIITIGSISCLLMALFWDKVTLVTNSKHSIAFLVLSFFLALVDCTSTVVFLSFMAIFPPFYLSALMLGETMSSMLPGFLAIAQGIGENTPITNITSNATNSHIHSHKDVKFSPSVFFLFLLAMMLTSGTAFLALNYLPVAMKQHVKTVEKPVTPDERDSLLNDDDIRITSRNINNVPSTVFIFLLVINAWVNCLSNGVIPTVQVYACKPYGNKPYHLAVTLSSISSAVTAIMAMWLPCRSSFKVACLAFVYTSLSGYILTLAIMSPNPPLQHVTSGAVLMVVASILSSCLITYTKLAIYVIARKSGSRALFWCGITAQIGSFLGAVTMFPLVNVAKVFQQA